MTTPGARWRRAAMALACACALTACDDCGEDGPTADTREDPGARADDRPVFDDPELPGVTRADRALTAELRAAAEERGVFEGGDEPRWVNRLARERSPYLLLHADNPVNWFPWGEEARERARAEDKPIFLSIGYAACHWCHVMERESFEDPEVARFINQHFIPVKVDREERPDVDEIFIRAVTMLAGRAGWPLTVVLTPEGEPFFGGTYFPPEGERGLVSILRELAERYETAPEGVVEQAGRLSRRLEVSSRPSLPGDVPGPEVVEQAARTILSTHDARHGGFGHAPKFPAPAALGLLLRYHRRTDEPLALEAVERTLDGMADGGIHDRVGGGFHRYAVDARWLVPHFEKMLYDNAQLAEAYIEGWQVTGREEWAEVARRTLAFVDRELSTETGAFASSLSADSPAPGGVMEEGRYYTWTPAELAEALGPERATVAARRWGVSESGHVEGRSVLHVSRPLDADARELGVPPARLREQLADIREHLSEARATRPRPARDDKVVAAWNGLAISAFARAAVAFGDDGLADRAARAATFVLDAMRDGDGTLRRSAVGDETGAPAVLEDYAFVVRGLIDLYEATGEPRWLTAAIALTEVMDEGLADPEGGWFQTSEAHGPLLARLKPHHDQELPSGNAVAIESHLRLAELTGETGYREAAEEALGAFAGALRTQGHRMARMVSDLERTHDVPREIAIVHRGRGAGPLRDRVGATFTPNSVLVVLTEEAARAQSERLGWLEGKTAIGGRATAYVCERGRCELPTGNPAVLGRQLAEAPPLLPDETPAD